MGYGIVEFAHPEEARRAIGEMTNSKIHGRTLSVREDREANPGDCEGGSHGGSWGGGPCGGGGEAARCSGAGYAVAPAAVWRGDSGIVTSEVRCLG